jgi:hypothetical protein
MEWEKQARYFIGYEKFMTPRPGIPVHVTAICYCKGVLPDLSGALESVGDAFQGILWANDKQIESWDGSRVLRDTKNPRTEITVEW